MFTNVLQPAHLLIVLIVALLLLGPKRLPEAGRALGNGLKEFRARSAVNRTAARSPRLHPPLIRQIPPATPVIVPT